MFEYFKGFLEYMAVGLAVGLGFWSALGVIYLIYQSVGLWLMFQMLG